MKAKIKAICMYNDGNQFDPKVGEVVKVKTLYITKVWRGEKELSIKDKQGYFKSQEMILAMLQEGDDIENNYCHGQYKVVD